MTSKHLVAITCILGPSYFIPSKTSGQCRENIFASSLSLSLSLFLSLFLSLSIPLSLFLSPSIQPLSLCPPPFSLSCTLFVQKDAYMTTWELLGEGRYDTIASINACTHLFFRELPQRRGTALLDWVTFPILRLRMSLSTAKGWNESVSTISNSLLSSMANCKCTKIKKQKTTNIPFKQQKIQLKNSRSRPVSNKQITFFHPNTTHTYI